MAGGGILVAPSGVVPVAPTASFWTGVTGLVKVPGSSGYGRSQVHVTTVVVGTSIVGEGVLDQLLLRFLVVAGDGTEEVHSATHVLGDVVGGGYSIRHGGTMTCGTEGVVGRAIVLRGARMELANTGVESGLHPSRGCQSARGSEQGGQRTRSKQGAAR